MRLDDEEESTNFEDRTGQSGGGAFGGLGGLAPLLMLGGGRLGCGGIALIIVVLLVLGINPLQLLGTMEGTGGGGFQAPTHQGAPANDSPATKELKSISRKVLGSTERRWGDIFREEGATYTPPTLVFYSRQNMSGCGAAQSAMGPFYCPADQKIYLDTDFFDEMKTRFDAPGDFPIGYIIAHEVGHHVQHLLGIDRKVRQAQQDASEATGNALQVKMELQADCYAGVWAKRDVNLMEPGDLEEGMRAAQAIGDDTLQRSAGQTPVPDSFTHGTSAQRMKWLRKGLDTGDPGQCDTFGGNV